MLKEIKRKIPNKVYVLSAVVGGVGFACLIKDSLGGHIYKGDKHAGEGKVVIVTGANTGIGKETAMELARRGAKVYMACQNLKRCEEAREKIVMDSKNKYVYCRKCDLASLQSVRDFVKQFKAEQNRLDILINNAGVMRTPHAKTQDGFEMQMGVNYLGHFLLTNLLLEDLKRSAPSRIINVSSVAHKKGEIKKDDFNSENSYDPAAAYSQSKLANILFTKELAKRLEGTGVTVNAVHPGIADTEITRHMSFYGSYFSSIFLKPFMWPFIKSPRQGAQPVIYLALAPEVEKVTGKYFSDCEESEPADQAKDNKTALWLWKTSEAWTRL